MNLYIALFRDGIPEELEEQADQLIEGESYRLTDDALLLQTWMDSIRDVREALEMGKSRAGVVFLLGGSYSGHFNKSLWKWLRTNREAALA